MSPPEERTFDVASSTKVGDDWTSTRIFTGWSGWELPADLAVDGLGTVHLCYTSPIQSGVIVHATIQEGVLQEEVLADRGWGCQIGAAEDGTVALVVQGAGVYHQGVDGWSVHRFPRLPGALREEYGFGSAALDHGVAHIASLSHAVSGDPDPDDHVYYLHESCVP